VPDIGARDYRAMSARLGLGLAALGRPGYLNLGHGADLGTDRSVAALRSRAHAVLDAAYAAGVRDFDAARSYGRGEEFLGEWLRTRDPEGVRVSSKWGYVYTAGWEVATDPPEVKHHDLDTFRRQLAETRAQLGDWLSLYQIHSATPESGVLENEPVLDAMVEAGVPLGVSVSGVSQAETIERALALGIFSAVQATWNLHERAAEPALARAHAAGLAVYVKEALANGRLAAPGRAPALDAAAAALETAPDALALAVALTRPWSTVVLSGAATIDTLHSNLRARDLPFVPALDSLREDSASYWKLRSTLPWN
jgi:aryl-alcohol dehydrogenase-like predicted oxidoreductase